MATILAKKPTPQRAREMAQLLRALDAYRGYENDWDPDGPTLEDMTVESAKSLVRRVEAASGNNWIRPGLGASSHGEIGLTWEADGQYVHVTVSKSEPLYMVTKNSGQDPVLHKVDMDSAYRSVLKLLGNA